MVRWLTKQSCPNHSTTPEFAWRDSGKPQDSRYPSWDKNRAHPEYKSRALSLYQPAWCIQILFPGTGTVDSTVKPCIFHSTFNFLCHLHWRGFLGYDTELDVGACKCFRGTYCLHLQGGTHMSELRSPQHENHTSYILSTCSLFFAIYKYLYVSKCRIQISTHLFTKRLCSVLRNIFTHFHLWFVSLIKMSRPRLKKHNMPHICEEAWRLINITGNSA
jgi:hypothetical protein